jgi:hypothetical protein
MNAACIELQQQQNYDATMASSAATNQPLVVPSGMDLAVWVEQQIENFPDGESKADLRNRLALFKRDEFNWEGTTDPDTGKTYFYHKVTREPKWTTPLQDFLDKFRRSGHLILAHAQHDQRAIPTSVLSARNKPFTPAAHKPSIVCKDGEEEHDGSIPQTSQPPPEMYLACQCARCRVDRALPPPPFLSSSSSLPPNSEVSERQAKAFLSIKAEFDESKGLRCRNKFDMSQLEPRPTYSEVCLPSFLPFPSFLVHPFFLPSTLPSILPLPGWHRHARCQRHR